MVAAIMGAHARLGIPHEHKEFESLKEAAEKRKKTTSTPELFDRQVRHRLGEAFFDKVFLPVIEKFVDKGLSYEEVKRVLKVPSTWGAKISGEQFKERTTESFGEAKRQRRKAK
jgi:hypothetical protein